MKTPVGLSWARLNEELMATDDEVKLAAWLREALDGASMSMGRMLRIHGRLNGVRRAREIREIQDAIKRKKKQRAA